MKHLIIITLFLCYCFGACTKTVAIEPPPDVPGPDIPTKPIELFSSQLRVKTVGDDLYISAKLDKDTDILYWFKKCMFNELYTFYRVGLISNSSRVPTNTPDVEPTTLLNLAFSDNIGPFSIVGNGWCGGNHPYIDEKTKTARNVSFKILLDGKELKDNTLTLVDNIQIDVVNEIMNPSKPTKINGKTALTEVLCTETATYKVKGGNIQVSVDHLFKNDEPVNMYLYYGMQSMFNMETYTLTANGKYPDWTPQAAVSKFLKSDYPTFRRFLEKNATAYQSSYLFDEGLGNHAEIADNDVIFIGNSNGKTYHKIVANKIRKKGDSTHWSGLYTWFKSPIIDDEDVLCYEGLINGKETIFIDCKKSVNKVVTLPEKYKNKSFIVKEKSNGLRLVSNKVSATSELKISSDNSGSFVLIF
ncbi:MAG: hypothetical protein RR383_06335 [Muribaculaceae bacterium]